MIKTFRFIYVFFILQIFVFNFTDSSLLKASDDLEHQYLNKEKQGKRIFLGLRYTNKISCVSCHNIRYKDTLNWNPSASDISFKYENKSIEDYKQILNTPLASKMSEVHKGYNFSDDDLSEIQAYLKSLVNNEVDNKKISVNKLALFFFLGLLITLALTDLIFTKIISYKIIPLGILFIALGAQSYMIYSSAVSLGRHKDYAPDQPIKFSHKIHATDNKIDCRYCHSDVDKSKVAGIPSANVCMNCHTVVREGTNSGAFEINKIHDAVNKNIPIRWVKVHNLPDHVFFSHSQHVNAGKQDCNKCHGEVEQMHIVRQVEDLSMGWCLDCHDKTKVNFDNNSYYKNSYKKLHQQIKKGLIDSVMVKDIGGRDCARCHY